VNWLMHRRVLLLCVVFSAVFFGCLVSHSLASGRRRAPAKEIYYIERAQKFHDTWGKEAGVNTTAFGLQYRILTRSGNTTRPKLHDVVEVRFEIAFPIEEHPFRRIVANNVYVDARTEALVSVPVNFSVHQMLPGWQLGVGLMSEGDHFELYLPHELAYGRRGRSSTRPAIPIFSPLIINCWLDRIFSRTPEQVATDTQSNTKTLGDPTDDDNDKDDDEDEHEEL